MFITPSKIITKIEVFPHNYLLKYRDLLKVTRIFYLEFTTFWVWYPMQSKMTDSGTLKISR
jgi:hypothetical protein